VASTRRSDWAESRDALLRAAHELFSDRGYESVTMKQIAEAAGLTEVTAYRHFATKAELFEQSAIEPTHDFLQEWVARWRERPAGERDTAEEGMLFFRELMAVLTSEQRLMGPLIAAVASGNGGGRLSAKGYRTMSRLLDELEAIFAEESALRGYSDNPRIAPRLIMAMALGITTQKHWLFATGHVPTDDELLRELVNFTVWGLTGPPHR